MRVRVHESYRDWAGPPWLKSTTGTLLEHVDDQQLSGLAAVVLTNTGALTGDRKRGKTWSRSRKVRLDACSGLYHPRTGNEPAWVEIFADKLLAGVSRWEWRVPLLREGLVGHTLYHELGHHIHATQAPEHRERETVADEWRDRLLRRMYQRRYPVLSLLLRAVARSVLVARRILRPSQRKSAQSGRVNA